MKMNFKLAICTAVVILAGWTTGAPAAETEAVTGHTVPVDLMDLGNAERTGFLQKGESMVYEFQVLEGRNLTVRVAAHGADLHYQIMNPDGSLLLEKSPADHVFQGELETSGEYAVEIINGDEKKASFDVILGLD